MKKTTHLIIATAVLSIMACAGNKVGYAITGTVEGSIDGDTVFLQKMESGKMIKLDTAIVTKGQFIFEGVQDNVVTCYATCDMKDKSFVLDFFLENGKINITMERNNDSATGTPNNDAYQSVRNELNALAQKIVPIYDTMEGNTLTEEQKKATQEEIAKLEKQYQTTLKEGIQKNITNVAGIYLFKIYSGKFTTAENDALLKQIPVKFMTDGDLIYIKAIVNKQKSTDVGAKFTDFEMKDPTGKMIKLSDYAGKGKVVLLDFWASWCGPCRADMPTIVKTYAALKGKNFEIIGVSLDKEEAPWKNAIKELKMPWPQMSDLKGWENAAAQIYTVNSIPHTVLIDGNGIIIANDLRGEELQAKLAEVVK